MFDVAWEQIEGIEAEKARKAAQRSIPVYSNPTDIPVSRPNANYTSHQRNTIRKASIANQKNQ